MNDEKDWLCLNCSKHMHCKDKEYITKQGVVVCSPRCIKNYHKFMQSGRKITIHCEKNFLQQHWNDVITVSCHSARIGRVIDQSPPPSPPPQSSSPPNSPLSPQLLSSLDHHSW